MRKDLSTSASSTENRRKTSSVAKEPEDVFGCLRREVQIVGDLLTPLVPTGDWDSCKES